MAKENRSYRNRLEALIKNRFGQYGPLFDHSFWSGEMLRLALFALQSNVPLPFMAQHSVWRWHDRRRQPWSFKGFRDRHLLIRLGIFAKLKGCANAWNFKRLDVSGHEGCLSRASCPKPQAFFEVQRLLGHKYSCPRLPSLIFWREFFPNSIAIRMPIPLLRCNSTHKLQICLNNPQRGSRRVLTHPRKIGMPIDTLLKDYIGNTR